jgi:hypothetical protein
MIVPETYSPGRCGAQCAGKGSHQVGMIAVIWSIRN